jgi:hypothetical protein
VRTAVVLASVLLILALNVLASVRVLRSDLILRAQKIAWLAFAWLVPLIGAILALQVSTERSTPAPVRGSYGMGTGAGDAGGPISDSFD